MSRLYLRSETGQGLLTPQQMVPQPPFIIAPPLAQWSPLVQAGPVPHIQTAPPIALLHCSPKPQHALPHCGPVLHAPLGAQLGAMSGFGGTVKSGIDASYATAMSPAPALMSPPAPISPLPPVISPEPEPESCDCWLEVDPQPARNATTSKPRHRKPVFSMRPL